MTAAGHLSSASIYPACLAPYLIVTACSDKSVYFWRCEMDSIEPFGSIGGMDPLDDYLSTSITSYEMSIDDQRIFTKPTYSTQVKNMSLTTRYQWQEWTMMNRLKKSSSISIPGKLLHKYFIFVYRMAYMVQSFLPSQYPPRENFE